MDRRVNVPIQKAASLEFSAAFDANFVFEDELEVGRWTFLNKVDRHLYEVYAVCFKMILDTTYLSIENICT